MPIYSDPEAKRAAEMLRAGSTDGRVGSTAAPTTDDRLDALANLLRLHLNVQQRLNDDIVTLMKERFDVVRVLATLQSIERRLSAIEAHRADPLAEEFAAYLSQRMSHAQAREFEERLSCVRQMGTKISYNGDQRKSNWSIAPLGGFEYSWPIAGAGGGGGGGGGGETLRLQGLGCGCIACACDGVQHASDCAVHNNPTMAPATCSCGASNAKS